jgi:hypothetical protein
LSIIDISHIVYRNPAARRADQDPAMSPTAAPSTTLAETVLRALRIGNLLFCAVILGLCAWSFAYEARLETWLAALPVPRDPHVHLIGLRVLIAFGVAGVALVHRILGGLLAIVRTVRQGDPFVPDNAGRLRRIAWLLLAGEVLHLVAGAFMKLWDSPSAPLDWSFSWTGWVAVVMLFTLAHVFAAGTRLREDLEGTV